MDIPDIPLGLGTRQEGGKWELEQVDKTTVGILDRW